jgi:hypothetical protein
MVRWHRTNYDAEVMSDVDVGLYHRFIVQVHIWSWELGIYVAHQHSAGLIATDLGRSHLIRENT